MVESARIARAGTQKARRALLTISVAADLLVLAYFKYSYFLASNVMAVFGIAGHPDPVVLPLGISFFTFTQIAFLVDTARGLVREFNFIHFVLFVTYFPHLIAGPVLHHKEMMPQFAEKATYRFSSPHFLAGLSLFAFGLFKKAIVADSIAPYVNVVFDHAHGGAHVGAAMAWAGAIAYALQIYFDFSGYSDMAIGLARMMNVRLPLNFNSPYKAINIIDFWRRWHMTLSRFLRDYLYFSLGGNRHGRLRRYANLMITMLLGGLWHGAGWTFLVWGGLHGIFLVINHAWHALRRQLPAMSWGLGQMASTGLTFSAVVVAWTFFRAADLHTAYRLLSDMTGLAHRNVVANGIGFSARTLLAGEIPLLLVVWFFPNTQEIMSNFPPAFNGPSSRDVAAPRWLLWQPNLIWSVCTGLLLTCSVLTLSTPSDFIYFNF